MILTLIASSMISIIPIDAPVDALVSMQLADIQRLLDSNVKLSDDSNKKLIELVDELIMVTNSALVSLEQSRSAHDQLVQLNQNGIPQDSNTTYEQEFQKRIQNSNIADSQSAALLQEKIGQAQKTNQFTAIDAQASVQTWQALNRISMQLAELTEIMKTNHKNTRELNLDKFSKVLLPTNNGGSRSAKR